MGVRISLHFHGNIPEKAAKKGGERNTLARGRTRSQIDTRFQDTKQTGTKDKKRYSQSDECQNPSPSFE